MKTYRVWTEEEDDILRERYPDDDTRELAESLGRTRAAVYGRAFLLGIEKSWASRSKSGYAATLKRLQRSAGEA
jgi:hypothetical protein